MTLSVTGNGILERDGEVVYFTSSAGERFRVYDVAFGPPLCRPHYRRRLPLEDPRANHRWFVPEFGVPRVYRFARDEPRELAVERLSQQLRGAGFAAVSAPNVSAVRPT